MHFSSRKMLIEWQRTENFGEWLDTITTPLWVKTRNKIVQFISKRKTNSAVTIKVLFNDRRRRQNFCSGLLRLVDTLYTVIHKIQKTRIKVLPSATVGE